jgi:4-diphosphocytidyl-2-C-methyl-D-erythritol kinase
MSETAVTVPAHAKLNLFLRVLARESDGYHGLETLFCLVSLADTLRAERREGRGVTIEVEGADVGPPEQNLAVRAAGLVLEATGQRFAVHLTVGEFLRAGLGRRAMRPQPLATNVLASGAARHGCSSCRAAGPACRFRLGRAARLAWG